MRLKAFQPKATTLIRVLWAWWALCSLVLLGVWATSFYNSARYELKAREAAVFAKVSGIPDAFRHVDERTASVLFPSLKALRAGTFSEATLNEMRRKAGPVYRMSWVDTQGRPVIPGDTVSRLPATALEELAQQPRREGVLYSLWSHDDRGEPYLIMMERRGDRYLAAAIDFAHVTGPWLEERFRELGFGPGVTYRILTTKEAEAWRETKGGSDLNLTFDLTAWQAKVSGKRWERVTTLSDVYTQNSFPQVMVKVETVPQLMDAARLHAIALLLGLALMGTFALAVRLAQRGVRQELELAEARSNFTAMVSHELKTPVAAIRMYSEILGSRMVDDPEKVGEYHGIIRHEADRLQRLIENLLALGQIERGAVQYRTAPEDLNGLVELAAQHASAPFPQADEWLTMKLAPALPAAMADHEAALQALTNVIHNGFKYGGKPPRVEVSTRQSGPWLVVEVADGGPGIPAHQRQAVFEPYKRLENEATRETQGTGLGLALVKASMEGQGGSVEVGESESGGAVLRLRFPVEKG